MREKTSFGCGSTMRHIKSSRVIRALIGPKIGPGKMPASQIMQVHPVVREAVYRSIHRVVAKVMVQNESGDVLMGKVERGHFKGFWTLPGGYLDHNEHPAIGCVRETMEELGLKIVLDNHEPVITQRVFNDEGISFISLTYRSTWNGSLDELTLQTEEIAEAKWFSPDDAVEQAVSHFDQEALRSLLSS
jgi:ADP-ribose pyrophosphatase YjhB (NUDIX family)